MADKKSDDSKSSEPEVQEQDHVLTMDELAALVPDNGIRSAGGFQGTVPNTMPPDA